MDRPTEIGSSIVIRGELTAREDVVISGRVEGSIHSEGYLVTVNAGAALAADALAREIIVTGRVVGTLSAKERISLGPKADVEGELLAPAITIADGAVFQGAVETTAERKARLQLAS